MPPKFVMTGDDLRRIRELRRLDQQEMAQRLNEQLGRSYDRSRVSRWESGSEKIPQIVAAALQAETTPTEAVSPGEGAAVILAVANQKGGVGKTTTCVNLAFLLGRKGYRVLLVDCDGQANATMHLALDPLQEEHNGRTLDQVIFSQRPLNDAVVRVCGDLFGILPASINLSAADTDLIREPNGSLVLREKIDEARPDWDFIILDCAPNLGLLTVNALNAADTILIPSQTEMLSIAGIPKIMETISKIRRRINPKLGVIGILPTLHKARRAQNRDMMEQLRAMAMRFSIPLFDSVPDAADYGNGVTAGRPAIDLNPAVPGADAYAAVADSLVEFRRKRLTEGAHAAA